jgi:predicted ribosomally synthesized peptide with SipW-like signal peptide
LALNKKFAGIAGGITAIGATVALTAGTFSYFTDSETVGGGANQVNFGTLDLQLSEGAAQKAFAFDHAAPGDTVLPKTNMTFNNAGDMAGELRIRFDETDPTNTAYNDAILITLAGVPGFVDGKPYTLTQVAAGTRDADGNGIHVTTLTPSGDPDGYDSKGFPMTVTIDPKAGNDLQGVSGGFKIEADLVQSGADGRALQWPAPKFPAQPKQ